MSMNFNVSPYYDDFDSAKNFHRILFKPGYAVQARELTQAQTILQDQITKFADNIFKQNSPVTGGQVTTNFACFYVKLQETYNNVGIDVTKFNGLSVKNADGTVLAKVLAVASPTGTDPSTLILSYSTGGHFNDNDVIYDANSNLAVQALAVGSTGSSSVVSIDNGVFYVLGNFVQVAKTTTILSKYSNTPSLRVGLNITETIKDHIDDTTLLDPAIGASNYQAPGADRYQINLTLETRPLTFGDDDGFIELLRIDNGNIFKMVDGSVYSVIDDYFAKRDYETNGDYVVNDFKLTPKTSQNDPLANTYTMSIGKGIAYVRGHRMENQSPIELISNRARTTESQNNRDVFFDYGSYFFVDNVKGLSGSFFDVATYQSVDFHCVNSANVVLTTANTYNSTLVGTGYIRALTYDSATSSNTTSYVYKSFVSDIQNNSLSANVVSGTTNTITFPSTFSSIDNAYVGVSIAITKGTNIGDTKTITAYNGTTKTATVSQNWFLPLDTTSVFTLNFDIKDIESIAAVNKSAFPATTLAKANINPQSKMNGLITGDTVLQNPTGPELVFNVGEPYVAQLKNTSYETTQMFRNVTFTTSAGTISAQLNFSGDYAGVMSFLGSPNSQLSSDNIKQNYTIIVIDKGSNTLINNGDIVDWTTSPTRIATLGDASAVVTFSATDLLPFTATIIAKAFVNNADNSGHILKFKNLITGNTAYPLTSNTTGVQVGTTQTFIDDTSLTSSGQVFIGKAGLLPSGVKQSLYLSDVKNIVKIVDSKDANTAFTAAMISNPANDVTNNYIFDNGQRDNYYDHASITLAPGAAAPVGNLLIILNYYQHTGGDGYFSVQSYLTSNKPESYIQIPNYLSKHGLIYSLRDCIDFRPSRKNGLTTFTLRYSNVGDTSKYGALIPVDSTTFVGDYSYYLGRNDKLVLTKDKSFQIIEGSPSLHPIFPPEPDGALIIATLKHNPYTGFIPTEAPPGFLADLSVEKVQHKRYTMQDIAGLEGRLNQVEYYTSLNALEQSASSMQVSDAFGLNRFKNGILTDDFSSYSTSDTYNNDNYVNINRRTRKATAPQTVKNFPLKNLSLLNGGSALSATTLASLGYGISTDGHVNYYSLPFTTKTLVAQKLASRVIDINPFSFPNTTGLVSLTPNIDNWVDTNYSPSLLITDPSLQVFQQSQSINVLSVGDWQAVSGTSWTTSDTSISVGAASTSTVNTIGHGINPSPFGFIGYSTTTTSQAVTTTVNTTTTTQVNSVQKNVLGAYSAIGNTYALNNGYIQDISILPWIREQQIVVRGKGMLLHTPVSCYFDAKNVDLYVRKTNVIELTGVSGIFNENDIIGAYQNGVFTPTAAVVGVYVYPNTNGSQVRLYVAADPNTTNYAPNSVVENAFFNSSGVYQNRTARGSLSSTTHYGGRVRSLSVTSGICQIQLSPLASAVDNAYVGQIIYLCSGKAAGQYATITAYNGTLKVVTVDTPIYGSFGDIYSMGPFSTDEVGAVYGIFNLPANTFHTGQRVFRFDNRINNNVGSETTSAEGTFYAEGLQATKQNIDFGASPAGAKGTFIQTNSKTDTYVSKSTTSSTQVQILGVAINRWDPVAQTFLIDSQNYPNGVFLSSVKIFFSSKPATGSSPVTLSVVGTLNGYPNGQTLDHGIVEVNADQVNVSATPQYLDPTAYTEFKFKVPVYVAPDVLYAFILKSDSDQYRMWVAAGGDTAVASSVKNLPTDPTPTVISKISAAPYVGSLFISQNSQTWTADQNQSLMFTIDSCVFDTTAKPIVEFVVPKKLPQRALIEESLNYFGNANAISNTVTTVSNSDILVDAFNITTTDFTPSTTNINYSYRSTRSAGGFDNQTYFTPGKFGTSMTDHIYLDDGNGERVLQSNVSTSFTVYTEMTSGDPAVSPIISDAGLTLYTIKYNINNCELSNSLVSLTSSGAGYNVSTTTVTVSAPTGKNGKQAYAAANVVNGYIDRVYITNPGSGYITTPTITFNDANTTPGSGATATITGETSKNGGPGLTKYISKKVVLDTGFDSGDLNVYITAYRPTNTDILVYYKILNRGDSQKFEDSYWQLMTKTKNSDTTYSKTKDDLHEYSFAPGTNGVDQGFVSYTNIYGQSYNTFSQFAIKIVLVSTDPTIVPFLSDMRCLALPSNTSV